MKTGFLKFKNRIRGGTVAKALVFGLSLGILAWSLLWLWDKQGMKQPDFLLYASIGGGVALFGFSFLLVILFPTEKRLAKRLDNSLHLHERVQTMVAFRSDEGEMAKLQREDTERILAETPLRAARKRALWVHLIAPLVAAALLITAVAMPTKMPEPPPPPVDPDFQLSAWQEQALKDLIETVKRSEMQAAPKGNTVAELESLLTQLRSAGKVSTMKNAVIQSIQNIKRSVNDYNTYDLVAEALQGSSNDTLKQLGQSIGALNALQVSSTLAFARDALLSGEESVTRVLAFSDACAAAFSSQTLASDNAFSLAFAAFAVAVRSGDAELSEISQDALREKLTKDINTFDAALVLALLSEYTNEKVADETVLRLMGIFGIAEAELPADARPKKNVTGEDGDYKPDEEDQVINSGGLGSGEQIFGSDDTIYDPERGEYVSYGDVIHSYYAKITEQIVDGNIPADIEQLLSDYFAALYDGSENKQ